MRLCLLIILMSAGAVEAKYEKKYVYIFVNRSSHTLCDFRYSTRDNKTWIVVEKKLEQGKQVKVVLKVEPQYGWLDYAASDCGERRFFINKAVSTTRPKVVYLAEQGAVLPKDQRIAVEKDFSHYLQFLPKLLSPKEDLPPRGMRDKSIERLLVRGAQKKKSWTKEGKIVAAVIESTRWHPVRQRGKVVGREMKVWIGIKWRAGHCTFQGALMRQDAVRGRFKGLPWVNGGATTKKLQSCKTLKLAR